MYRSLLLSGCYLLHAASAEISFHACFSHPSLSSPSPPIVSRENQSCEERSGFSQHERMMLDQQKGDQVLHKTLAHFWMRDVTKSIHGSSPERTPSSLFTSFLLLYDGVLTRRRTRAPAHIFHRLSHPAFFRAARTSILPIKLHSYADLRLGNRILSSHLRRECCCF